MWTVLSLLAPKRRVHRARGHGFRPAVEALEDRYCLSPGVFEWADPTGGALDPTFGSGGQVVSSFSNHLDEPNAVAVQPDGKIVVVGRTLVSGSRTGNDFLVARYNANGTQDTTFGSGGYTATDFQSGLDRAYAVALLTNGKILVVGGATVKNSLDVALAQYNPNGTLDTTFGSRGKVTTDLGGNEFATSVVVDGAGRILVREGSTLLRYTAGGALDTTFGSKGKAGTALNGGGGPESIALQADGKILVGGIQFDSAGHNQLAVARLTGSGAVDTTFGSGGVANDHVGNQAGFGGLAVQSDGKIVVAGSEGGRDPDGVARQGAYLLRYNVDGSLDGTFASGGIAYLVNPAGLFDEGWGGVAIQSNGQIVDGMRLMDNSGTQPYFGALRVSASGALDAGYGDGGWASVSFGTVTSVNAMAMQPDGRVIVAGYTKPSGTTYPMDVALCRFLPSAPQIGSFTASAYTVTAGSRVTLTASNITDENSGSSVAQLAFYIMVNGNRVQLGYGTHNSDGSWSYAFDTTGYASGTYTLYAQATDSFGALGNPVALTLTIQ